MASNAEPTDGPREPSVVWAIVGAYSRAIGIPLAEGGFGDMPRNGPFMLAGTAGGAAVNDLAGELGLDDRAASGLVDALVGRGYAERRDDPSADPHRLEIGLTARGRAAATAVLGGLASVDAALARMLPPEHLAALRSRRAMLAEVGVRTPGGQSARGTQTSE